MDNQPASHAYRYSQTFTYHPVHHIGIAFRPLPPPDVYSTHQLSLLTLQNISIMRYGYQACSAVTALPRTSGHQQAAQKMVSAHFAMLLKTKTGNRMLSVSHEVFVHSTCSHLHIDVLPRMSYRQAYRLSLCFQWRYVSRCRHDCREVNSCTFQVICLEKVSKLC